MKGSKEVIAVLNDVLAGELLAINQYFVHSKLDKNEGYTALAERLRAESVDQMSHADALMERILFLEAMPTVHMNEEPQIGQTVTERMQNDLSVEHHAIKRLNDGIEVARAHGDNASAALLCRLLTDEEEHAAWLQTQLGLIATLGENRYLLAQIRG